MKVLIIEDEPYAQEELKRLLAKTGFDIEIVSCLESVEDALEWFQLNPEPDLIFLDIQLSDGLSFEIFNTIKFTSPVIFTTAYDEYAIRAFALNSIDYLLKPVELEALNKSLEKFNQFKDKFATTSGGLTTSQIEQILQLGKANKFKSRFIVKVGEHYKHIEASDVSYFFAENNVVFMVNVKNQRYIIEYTLDQLTQMVDPIDFFRINRGYLVRINAIDKIHKYFNSRLKIELVPPAQEEVLISRVRVPDFLAWVDK